MFYRLIGYLAWNYVLKRQAIRVAKVGAGLAVVTIVATAYLASRRDSGQA